MKIANIVETYKQDLVEKYGRRLLPSHRKALDAILACKNACGHFTLQCDTCEQATYHALSCGHRSCPRCQNTDTTEWLQRQYDKLLPVPYFMVTFTLPSELRKMAWQNQSLIYDLLFKVAKACLQELAKDQRYLGAELGMTGVLHTHTRQLEYHPHVHFIVPGGGIAKDKGKTFFKQLEKDFLVHGKALAKLFRGRFIYALLEAGFSLPSHISKTWVVNVQSIGTGKPALQYLSRYLYRGVIAEKNIVACKNGKLTFKYKDSQTQTVNTRTLDAVDFIWKLLTHVLPRGFRRVRDYGIVHPNAKQKRSLIQLLLRVSIPIAKQKPKIKPKCAACQGETYVAGVYPKRIPMQLIFSP